MVNDLWFADFNIYNVQKSDIDCQKKLIKTKMSLVGKNQKYLI